MITLTEFSRSAESARAGRMVYEDLALVAHLSELEQLAAIAKRERREPSEMEICATGYGLTAGLKRSFERALSVFRPHSSASAK